MKNSPPVFSQTSIPFVIISLILVFLISLGIAFLVSDPIMAFLLSLFVFLSLILLLRLTLAAHHSKGVQLVKKTAFEPAIIEFEKSYAFLTRYPWIDKFRALTLLSPSAWSYREMALCNIAFCYLQLNQANKAVEYYNKALEEFPNSSLAKYSLKTIQSVQNSLGPTKTDEK